MFVAIKYPYISEVIQGIACDVRLTSVLPHLYVIDEHLSGELSPNSFRGLILSRQHQSARQKMNIEHGHEKRGNGGAYQSTPASAVLLHAHQPWLCLVYRIALSQILSPPLISSSHCS
jgi:hypothetical protein